MNNSAEKAHPDAAFYSITDEPYATVRNTDGDFYPYVKIAGNQLTYTAVND